MKHANTIRYHKSFSPELGILTKNYEELLESKSARLLHESPELKIPSKAEKLNSKRKIFMEMMGYPKQRENRNKLVPFNISIKTPSIAVTDFMGNSKFQFLKKAGFFGIYEECKNSDEANKILEDKNTLSLHSIYHFDTIREYALKNRSPKVNSYTVLPSVDITKTGKITKKGRIEKIQRILDKCSEAAASTKNSKRLKNVNFGITDSGPCKRTGKRKLTHVEKKKIKQNMLKID